MTSAELASNRDNFCYRHAGTQSFVLCQRCLRTICGECQIQAPVGVICPECLKAQRKAESPAQRRARRQRGAAASFAGWPPPITSGILVVTAFVGLLQLIPGFGQIVTGELAFYTPRLYPHLNPDGASEPWRLLSALLVHGGILHFVLNMFAVFLIGRSLEPILGRWRFLALYLLSGLGGSLAVALISPLTPVVGASGAVFGLLGAILVIGRSAGANMTGILILLGANLVIGFLPGFHIAWQAHIGGAVVGALVALILLKTRRQSQQRSQVLLLGAVGVGLLLLVAFLVPALIDARYF